MQTSKYHSSHHPIFFFLFFLFLILALFQRGSCRRCWDRLSSLGGKHKTCRHRSSHIFLFFLCLFLLSLFVLLFISSSISCREKAAVEAETARLLSEGRETEAALMKETLDLQHKMDEISAKSEAQRTQLSKDMEAKKVGKESGRRTLRAQGDTPVRREEKEKDEITAKSPIHHFSFPLLFFFNFPFVFLFLLSVFLSGWIFKPNSLPSLLVLPDCGPINNVFIALFSFLFPFLSFLVIIIIIRSIFNLRCLPFRHVLRRTWFACSPINNVSLPLPLFLFFSSPAFLLSVLPSRWIFKPNSLPSLLVLKRTWLLYAPINNVFMQKQKQIDKHSNKEEQRRKRNLKRQEKIK